MRPSDLFKLGALALSLLAPARAAAQPADPDLRTPAERAARPPGPISYDDRPPPIDSLRHRPPLIEAEYDRKKQGGYFTGLPLANADPNTGVGFGARVYYFQNGQRGDPRFAYTPYQHRIFLQTFFSTGGLQFHWLDYDAPALFSSAYRFRAAAILGRNTRQNYFGRGEDAMRDLTYTGSQTSYRRALDYEQAIEQVGPDGKTRALYNKLDMLRPQLLLSVERSLLGGLLRPLIGFGFSYTRIKDYSGDVVDARDAQDRRVEAPMAPTRLREDCDRGLVGCHGGWENVLRLALVYDTRDFEPDPNSGVMAEVSSELGSKVLGSDFDFARIMGSFRGFYSPFPSLADVVLAGRAVYVIQSQGTPFFSMNLLPFTEDFRLGLGGVRTLRGYKQDRFIGHVMAVTNFELRWTIGHVQTHRQDFGFIVAPFVDLGRVFDRVADTSLDSWKRTQGAALRVAWNQATIVMIDYGFSREDSGLYVNFNHIF